MKKLIILLALVLVAGVGCCEKEIIWVDRGGLKSEEPTAMVWMGEYYETPAVQNCTWKLIFTYEQRITNLEKRIKLLEEQLAGFVKIEKTKVKAEIPEPKFSQGDVVYINKNGKWEVQSIIGYSGEWIYRIANNFFDGAFRNSMEVKESELIKLK